MKPRLDLVIDITDDDNLHAVAEVDFDSPYDDDALTPYDSLQSLREKGVPERDIEALKQLIERYRSDKLNFRSR